jgi:hypothetical protein
MEKLKFYFFELREGDQDYAGYGTYNLIGYNEPTPSTIENFIKLIPISEEDISYRENCPINLLSLERFGEDFEAYWPITDLNNFLEEFDLNILINNYLIFEGAPQGAPGLLQKYNIGNNSEEFWDGGILTDNYGSPIIIAR